MRGNSSQATFFRQNLTGFFRKIEKAKSKRLSKDSRECRVSFRFLSKTLWDISQSPDPLGYNFSLPDCLHQYFSNTQITLLKHQFDAVDQGYGAAFLHFYQVPRCWQYCWSMDLTLNSRSLKYFTLGLFYSRSLIILRNSVTVPFSDSFRGVHTHDELLILTDVSVFTSVNDLYYSVASIT